MVSVRIILAFGVVLVGCVAVWWGWESTRPRAVVMPAPDVERSSDVSRVGVVAYGDLVSLDELAVSAPDVVRDQLGNAVPDPDGLGSVIQATMLGLALPTPEDFNDVLISQGVDPIPNLDMQIVRDRWDESRRLMSESSFDRASVLVRHSSEVGALALPEVPRTGSVIRRGDDRRPFLAAPGASAFDRVEVVVPGSVVAQDGTTFDGTFVFEFTHDPTTGLWAVTENRVNGVPIRVPMPALPL